MPSNLPEHIRVELPQLAELDVEVERLRDAVREAEGKRQTLIDDQARAVAKFAVGYEYEKRGSRYRVTKIKGEYYDYGQLFREMQANDRKPIVWVRYLGVKLFKNGKVDREKVLYDLPEVDQ